MNSLLYILLLAYSLQFSVTIEIQDCDNGIPKPYNLSVKSCVVPPCPLYRGDDAIAYITVDVLRDVELLNLKVVATLASMSVNYPIPDPNVCHTLLNGYCPLEEGERVIYMFKMPVKKFFPKVSLVLTLTISDEHDESMACFKLPCKVVDKPT